MASKCGHAFRNYLYHYRHLLVFLFAVLVLLPLPLATNGDQRALVVYITGVCVICIVSNQIPLAMCGLLGLTFIPLLGLASSKEMLSFFMRDNLLVFMGMLILSTTIEEVQLTRRIALTMIGAVGTGPCRLMWAFGFLSFVLSMITTNIAVMCTLLATVDVLLKDLKEHSLPKAHTTAEFLPDNELDEASTQTPKEPKVFTNKAYSDIEEELAGETTLSSINGDDCQKINGDTINLENRTSNTNEEVLPSKVIEEDNEVLDDNSILFLGKAITLTVRFGAGLGGMAFLLGSPSNVIVKNVIDDYYTAKGETSSPLNFGTWIGVCLPITLTGFVLMMLWIQCYYLGIRSFQCCSKSTDNKTSENRKLSKWLDSEIEAMGKLSFAEVVTIILVILLILVMFFQEPGFMPGWADLGIFKQGYIGLSVPVILITFLVFIIPSTYKPDDNGRDGPLLSWNTCARNMKWGVIFVIGTFNVIGVLARESGLDAFLSDKFSFLVRIPIIATPFVVCIFVIFFTEICPHALILYIFGPLVGSIAEQNGSSPIFLMLPLGLASQCSFMLTAVPINAVAISYNIITPLDLAKAGAMGNIIMGIWVAAMANSWLGIVLNMNDIPWRNDTDSSVMDLIVDNS